ncbi:hypothetical protein BDP27DRAFT_1424797 [Rhodocollybia butyracea]|uniref:Uncharacterized protein n=1 Tax=Rhodocollybia butyracea TaxID=206335 RepID=A0A9P5PNY6_9AGAR|nr:hypothetical protein BDP27DRAFT_1424797 [Rhodocollybia butyracea]
MAPIRAYYLPADSTPDIDASHPVSVEHLNALGWKLSSVGGSHDEIEQAGRKVAQELGFPVTQEGCIIPFNFNPEKNAATMDPEVIIADSPREYTLLTSKLSNSRCEISSANAAVIVVTSGSPYFDVEDVTTASWIRIHFVAGLLLCAPTGAKYRISFNEHNRETAGVAFYKETISNHGLLVKGEIDNHPARQVYLNAHT